MLSFLFFVLEKTKLPCQIAGKKIMFYGGSSNSVFIHYKTEKDVIKVYGIPAFYEVESECQTFL